ncbi:ATP-binding protein [Rubrivivax rivuli]|nr:adenylate/guanylate cyclase domain-containing protein [Rubrivivax rivuli]
MTATPAPEAAALEAGIAALEAQRATLGDAVVDAALGGLRARLAALQAKEGAAPARALKQVSLLFVDVVGSTMLSQHLDPEETSAVMDGALRRGTALVVAHGGRVVQYAGDSLLGVFGMDEANEDDAERAVRCGLRLLALGRELGAAVLAAHGQAGCDVRVGIHTGGVLVGGGGGGAGDESAVRGLAVNIAARMEQSAPAGALRISQDTWSQVRGLFEFSPPELLQVKGVDAPIVSHLVHKALPLAFRRGARGIEGVATRMVGREAQLAALQAAFQRLCTHEVLLAVTVVGEAGLGKSRLLDEFQAWTARQAEPVLRFHGRATPQSQGQPYALLRDLIATWLHIGDDDTLDEAKAKIEGGLMPLFADEPAFAQGHAHLLGHLIGLDWKDSPHLRGILDDPKQIHGRAQHTAVQMFRRLSRPAGAQRGTRLILQLEDLHWADNESLDFLGHLCNVNSDLPLWVLAFTRPTLFERRSHWPHERIDLQPLDAPAQQALVGELLQKLPAPPAVLTALITGRAEGNPFFTEELVRMLIDQGAIDASGDTWQLQEHRLVASKVPVTLTGVLQARLDGLPAAERLTLQEASVIGPLFWDRALIALDARAETTLPRLVRRELALPRQDTHPDGLREYAFQHALLHQVTYETVLKRERRLLHAKLAAWLAAQSESNSARAGDFLGVTAHHFQEAGAAAEAAEFHARAAEHAIGRLAHTAVLGHVQQGLALLDTLGPAARHALLRWRLLHVQERTLDFQGSREAQGHALDAMDGMAEALADDARRSYAANRRAHRALHMARHAECETIARRAVDLAEQALAQGSGSAQELHEQRLFNLRLQGLAAVHQGRPDEGQALLQQALDEGRVRGLFKLQAFCLNSLSALALRRGDHVRMLELARAALGLLRRAGDRRNEGNALINVGVGWLNLGHLDAAGQDLQDALRVVAQNGDRIAECACSLGLSSLAHQQDDDEQALALARRALDIAGAVRAPHYEVLALLSRGQAEIALGQLAAAAQTYTLAQRLAQGIGHGCRFDASASLARVALKQGDLAAALQQAEALMAMAAPPHDPAAGDSPDSTHGAVGRFDGAESQRLIELTLHQVLAAAGDPRADAWLHRAHREVQAQADTLQDAALRQMFLARIPVHREIVALWAARGGR